MDINEDIYRDLLGICLVDYTKIPYITTKVKLEYIPKGIYSIIYNSILHIFCQKINLFYTFFPWSINCLTLLLIKFRKDKIIKRKS